MQPEVSLNYSSQGGNGMLGLGWNLGGLSTIHRCPATLDQDGVRGSVKYDENDKYCMDGQRLIAISGTYGAADAEYRTEIDSISKILPVGGDPQNGPDSWKVYTKSGQTMEFGATEDSRWDTLPDNIAIRPAPGSGVYYPNINWMVNKITDAVGNAITYTYHKTFISDQGIEHYLSRIDYGGNSIRFDYDTTGRPDKMANYANGVKTLVQARLTSVASYAGEQVVRRYTPTYTITPTTQQSRIDSIEECAGSGSCLPATRFSYDGGEFATLGFDENVAPLTSGFSNGVGGWNANDHPRMMADVDGDGLDDIVGFANDGVEVRLSSGASFTTLPHFGRLAGLWNTTGHIRTMADVNGDGRADIVGFANNVVQYSLSQGNSFSDPVNWVTDYGVSQGWQPGRHPRMLADVDGDGKADIVGFQETTVKVTLGSGEDFAPLAAFGADVSWNDEQFLRTLADVNGDGLTDILGVGLNGVYVSLSEGTRFTSPRQWLSGSFFVSPGQNVGDFWPSTTRKWHIREMADVNGDGLPDLVGFGLDGVYVALNRGKSFESPQRWIDKYGFQSGEAYVTSRTNSDTGNKINGWHEDKTQRMLADLNGDGRADIIGFTGSKIYASLSLGGLTQGDDGFSEPFLWQDQFSYGSPVIVGPFYDNHPRMMADINGDGLPDAVGFHHTSVDVAYNSLPHAGQLRTIVDGNEIRTEIEYQSIAGPNAHYTKGSDANLDIEMDLQPPIQVVTRVHKGDRSIF